MLFPCRTPEEICYVGVVKDGKDVDHLGLGQAVLRVVAADQHDGAVLTLGEVETVAGDGHRLAGDLVGLKTTIGGGEADEGGDEPPAPPPPAPRKK
jgi:hypothetical protein